MDRLRLLTCILLNLGTGLAGTACSAQARSAPDATPANREAFTAPPEWRFPPGSILPVLGSGGMVSSTDRVATEIGVEMIRRGGNAVDAAVAVHFALAVVNPEAGNLGGGGFMLVRMADGVVAALDFRERAPLGASREMYLDAGGGPTNQSTTGHLATGVPGSVGGMWAAHQRFGSLPWQDLLQPAINLADGIVVHERLAESLQAYEGRLRGNPASEAALLPGGSAPRVGDRLEQPDLAETLRRIASDGHDGFYSGRTAELIELEMRNGGGLITREDLAAYAAVWRDPISFTYRDHTVLSMPPPSSGGATLAELLNILEGFALVELGHLSVDHVHLFAEAAKRAFVDRNMYLADPDFVEQPIDRMISKEYASERRDEIPLDRSSPADEVLAGLGSPVALAPSAGNEAENTTHFSVLDGAGGAVAVTTTLNSLYGNAITVAGAGFLLNNEMDDFTIQPGIANQFGLVQGEANTIEPGKRMLSAMAPTILLDSTGRVRLVTGSPGGPTIITTVAQLISNVVDFGMDAAAASAAPRLHHQHLPDVLRYELDGLPDTVAEALRARGHAVEERSGYSGDSQTILLRPDGTLSAAPDPRRGGAAAGVREEFHVIQ
jgi:gamma-glutamyltranspeptidase / glutathione hydrolase